MPNQPKKPPHKKRDDLPAVVRDRNGHFVKGTPTLNPHGPRKFVAVRDVLDKLVGPSGTKAFEILWEIAQGKVAVVKKARAPNADEDAASYAIVPSTETPPTIAERIEAAELILAYQLGKPQNNFNVNQTNTDIAPPANLSSLSNEQLLALADVHATLSKQPASTEVVDAVLTNAEGPPFNDDGPGST